MYDKSLVLELMDEVEEAFARIDRRFSGINTPDDFVNSDDGLDRLDGIAMMLIAIGENIKKIDKMTQGELLAGHPEIQWPGVKGVRDVLAHDYFNIDNEEIYNICSNDLPLLKMAIKDMRAAIE
jgi:uncharacterized protein with HEPN domain